MFVKIILLAQSLQDNKEEEGLPNLIRTFFFIRNQLNDKISRYAQQKKQQQQNNTSQIRLIDISNLILIVIFFSSLFILLLIVFVGINICEVVPAHQLVKK